MLWFPRSDVMAKTDVIIDTPYHEPVKGALSKDGWTITDDPYVIAYKGLRPSHGQIETLPVFDESHDQYLLLDVGWERMGRLHAVVLHVRLKQGKMWIDCAGVLPTRAPRDDRVRRCLRAVGRCGREARARWCLPSPVLFRDCAVPGGPACFWR